MMMWKEVSGSGGEGIYLFPPPQNTPDRSPTHTWFVQSPSKTSSHLSSVRPKPKLPTEYLSRNIQQVPLYPQCDIITRSALPVQGNASGEVCQTRKGTLDTVIAGIMGPIATCKGESPQLQDPRAWMRRCGSVFADLGKLGAELHLTGPLCAAGRQPMQTADTMLLHRMWNYR
jgi:hypothetical protein